MAKVLQLTIYPIKGMGGINVVSAYAMPAGFEYDRRWMLIDQQHRFVSQRNNTDLALMKIDLNQSTLTVTFRGDSIFFDTQETSKREFLCDVWDDKVLCVEVDSVISEWFSNKLGFKTHLVKIKSEEARQHHSYNLGKDIQVSLADGYPYLLLGNASIDQLRDKMNKDIDVSRFRPNIFIESEIAHEEDGFNIFSIGSSKFQNVKPCARCQVVTIDQYSGEIDKNILKTLSTYRNFKNAVYFGTNAICTLEGEVHVGDEILLF
jgi:hypothetical protein